MLNFRNGNRILASLIPYIMSFFGGTRGGVSSREASQKVPYVSPIMSNSVWGNTGMNFHEIQRARRRARRGKMYRRYRHSHTRSMRVKVGA